MHSNLRLLSALCICDTHLWSTWSRKVTVSDEKMARFRLENGRQCFRIVFVLLYLLLVVVLLPAVVLFSLQQEIKKRDTTALVGGLFVILALPVSMWEIVQHMIYYSKPSLQKHIIRILWMVPIYALNGWVGLVFPNQGIYVDCARECYEAYVIYNFLVYLLNYLNAEMDLEINLSLKPQVKHTFPLCWLPDWRMGRELVYCCKHGILQYTIIRPLTTAIAFVCELKGVYGEGQFRANVAFPYVIAANNLSQFMAMYCLVLFYRANKEELRPMRPIGKFLCIKAVVFFSFFQGMIISIYTGVYSSYFDDSDEQSATAISNKVQNFLICIEMFLAAIAHHYSFSYEPYVNELVEKRTLCEALIAMWDVSDVQADLKEHFGVVGNSISNINRQFRGQNTPNDAESGETSRLLVPAIPGTPKYNTCEPEA